MATATDQPPRMTAPGPDPIGASKRLLTIQDYLRMGETGILGPDERVELIEGEVYKMTPIGPEHLCVLLWLAHALRASAPHPLMVVEQGGLNVSASTQVQPDIMLLKNPLKPPHFRSITPVDVALIVEVSASSILFDRGAKRSLYAAAGIAEYWIVDIAGRQVDRYSDPSHSGYASTQRFTATDQLSSVAMPNVRVGLSELFESLANPDPT